MSLLDRAKQKARTDQSAKEKEERLKKEQREFLDKALVKLSKDILTGLQEFHKVETRFGTLKLVRKKNINQIAVLKLAKSNGPDLDLLYIKASVVSGFRDYSDDCRNEPFTEAQVTLSTEGREDALSYQYHRLEGVGLRSFHGYVTNWNDNVTKTLGEVADWLAPLFTTR